MSNDHEPKPQVTQQPEGAKAQASSDSAPRPVPPFRVDIGNALVVVGSDGKEVCRCPSAGRAKSICGLLNLGHATLRAQLNRIEGT